MSKSKPSEEFLDFVVAYGGASDHKGVLRAGYWQAMDGATWRAAVQACREAIKMVDATNVCAGCVPCQQDRDAALKRLGGEEK